MHVVLAAHVIAGDSRVAAFYFRMAAALLKNLRARVTCIEFNVFQCKVSSRRHGCMYEIGGGEAGAHGVANRLLAGWQRGCEGLYGSLDGSVAP